METLFIFIKYTVPYLFTTVACAIVLYAFTAFIEKTASKVFVEMRKDFEATLKNETERINLSILKLENRFHALERSIGSKLKEKKAVSISHKKSKFRKVS